MSFRRLDGAHETPSRPRGQPARRPSRCGSCNPGSRTGFRPGCRSGGGPLRDLVKMRPEALRQQARRAIADGLAINRDDRHHEARCRGEERLPRGLRLRDRNGRSISSFLRAAEGRSGGASHPAGSRCRARVIRRPWPSEIRGDDAPSVTKPRRRRTRRRWRRLRARCLAMVAGNSRLMSRCPADVRRADDRDTPGRLRPTCLRRWARQTDHGRQRIGCQKKKSRRATPRDTGSHETVAHPIAPMVSRSTRAHAARLIGSGIPSSPASARAAPCAVSRRSAVLAHLAHFVHRIADWLPRSSGWMAASA